MLGFGQIQRLVLGNPRMLCDKLSRKMHPYIADEAKVMMIINIIHESMNKERINYLKRTDYCMLCFYSNYKLYVTLDQGHLAQKNLHSLSQNYYYFLLCQKSL